MLETYSESEWNGAIASFGRLVDIRNFPDVAADILMGRHEAFLGRGTALKKKALDPKAIGALVFWTKGPVELLIEHTGLMRVLETYNQNRAVVGLELSVTGLGGTFLEPGIQSPEEVAAGLKRVLDAGFIDPEAIVLRYDPLLRVRAPDGRILRNDSRKAFESVVSLFAPLGVTTVETKALLLGEEAEEKYHHVWERITDLNIYPMMFDDFFTSFTNLSEIASKYGMTLFTCCIKKMFPDWASDSGCLSSERLTRVGRKRFGEDWDRISSDNRPSRPGCECSRYFDLSNVKGHKKCGSQGAACLYCTACSKAFGKAIRENLETEIGAFCAGKRNDFYQHLL